MRYERKLLTVGESYDIAVYDPIIIVRFDALEGKFLVERYFDDKGNVLDSERLNPFATYSFDSFHEAQEEAKHLEDVYFIVCRGEVDIQ